MNLKNNKILSCKEHIEIAIDEFINDNNTFPELIINELEQCNFCNEKSEYEIK